MFKIFVLNWNNLIVVIWSIGKSEFWKKGVSLLETWQEITVVETKNYLKYRSDCFEPKEILRNTQTTKVQSSVIYDTTKLSLIVMLSLFPDGRLLPCLFEVQGVMQNAWSSSFVDSSTGLFSLTKRKLSLVLKITLVHILVNKGGKFLKKVWCWRV